MNEKLGEFISSPQVTEDDEEGDLICQERNINFQIQSLDVIDRKPRDLDESENFNEPATLNHDDIFNQFRIP